MYVCLDKISDVGLFKAKYKLWDIFPIKANYKSKYLYKMPQEVGPDIFA